MEIVRSPAQRTSSDAGEEPLEMRQNSTGAATGERGEIGGGDPCDPRFFYFRALLDGDRFFSGGGRF